MENTLHELEQNRDKSHLFEDRSHAGRILAKMLAPYYGQSAEALVLAIPSGGVPIGVVLSRELELRFDLIIVRKLQIPGNTEAGFGALSLEGRVFLNEELLSRLQLERRQIQDQIAIVRKELEARNAMFRQSRPLPDVDGKTVILADDGLASGYTMIAAAATVREHGAQKVVVAVPTAPLSTIRKVAPMVDEIYSAHVQSYGPFAVASAYIRWRDLDREEVLSQIREAGA